MQKYFYNKKEVRYKSVKNLKSFIPNSLIKLLQIPKIYNKNH